MPPTPPDAQPGGLARSLQRLFAGEPPEPLDIPVPDGSRAAGDRLRSALGLYLATAPLARSARVPALRNEVRSVAGGTESPVGLADVVERLAREAGDDKAAGALAREFTTPQVAALLVDRLPEADRDEARRDEMIEVARVLGDRIAPALAEALHGAEDRGVRRALLAAMAAAAPSAPDVVAEMVSDERWFVVRNAVAVLGEVGSFASIEHLTLTLAHEHARVRRESVMALARVGGEDAGLLILGMLGDVDESVRAAAAMALGVLGVQRAVRPLLATLEEESSEDVQVEVLRALGQLRDPGAVSAIEKRASSSLFSRSPVPLRIAALRALSAIGTPHALSVLREAAQDKDPDVRAAVRNALRERGLD